MILLSKDLGISHLKEMPGFGEPIRFVNLFQRKCWCCIYLRPIVPLLPCLSPKLWHDDDGPSLLSNIDWQTSPIGVQDDISP